MKLIGSFRRPTLLDVFHPPPPQHSYYRRRICQHNNSQPDTCCYDPRSRCRSLKVWVRYQGCFAHLQQNVSTDQCPINIIRMESHLQHPMPPLIQVCSSSGKHKTGTCGKEKSRQFSMTGYLVEERLDLEIGLENIVCRNTIHNFCRRYSPG